MSGARTVALVASLWAIMTALAQADPISATSGSSWTIWAPANGTSAANAPSLPGVVPSLTGLPAAQTTTAPTLAASNANASAMSVMNAAAQTTAAAPQTITATATPTSTYDAFINMGAGPYPNEGAITTGGAQPWYDSGAIQRLFGGVPTAQQQASFENTVLQRVEQTFSLSGVPVTLTDNPNVPAAHTLSLISDTASRTLPNAIGMTNLGGSGFSFIDQIAPSAQSLDQLEWIVAHNISHELMLAFGVGENYDKSGNYIDAEMANWSMITSPDATFSTAAAQALLGQNFLANSDSTSSLGAQQVVPEPTTLALWGLAALAAALRARSRRRRGD